MYLSKSPVLSAEDTSNVLGRIPLTVAVFQQIDTVNVHFLPTDSGVRWPFFLKRPTNNYFFSLQANPKTPN